MPRHYRIVLVAVAAAASILTLGGRAVADPYLHVKLLGRVQGSGALFGSVIDAPEGTTIDYIVQIQLAPEGTTNANAGNPGGIDRTTIFNWVPSNAGTVPTSGLNSVRFSLYQNPVPNEMQVTFPDDDIVGTTTGGGTWGIALGSSNGVLTPRGNGFSDLRDVDLIREPGNFDGIGAGDVPEVLTIGQGTFQIATNGNPSSLTIGIGGMTGAPSLARFRWYEAGSNVTTLNYTQTLAQQNNSVAAGDPIIDFTGLTLIPEPGSLSILTLASLTLMRRQR